MIHNTQPAPEATRSRRGRNARMKALAIGSALTVLLAPGTAGASALKPDGGVVNLTWETMWSGPTLLLLKKMTTAFNASHPGIRVTEENIPSATGDAKLQSQIAAGDPPDIFTEWNPVIGEYAAKGYILNMNTYLTGAYKGFVKWMYPLAAATGTYKGELVGVPMSLNSWALYYNKSIMKAAGIMSPPTTLAQLTADQAKEWTISGGKLSQIGMYPGANGYQYFSTFFGALNCFNSAGQYDYANTKTCPGATALMNWLTNFKSYPYAQVNSMNATYGAVAGGDDDPFVAGKEGFNMDGPWEGAQNIPDANPSMEGNFGVIPFPGTVGGPSTIGQGNFNIIPEGASNSRDAFEFITWLAGYNNVKFTSNIDPQGGWVPAGPQIAAAPAYQAYVKKFPWMTTYLEQMSSKYSQAPVLTTNQEQANTAMATASNDVQDGSMSPAAALKYIDTQANASS
jgi:multiple sugar transport system substrate-binding protein